jgi:hypothetical protein
LADVEGLVMTSQATKDSMEGDGIHVIFADRLSRRNRLQDALMWFFTSAGRLLQGDAAIFDVIDGGFRTIPPLCFEYLGDFSRPHRKWKLKDTRVTCGYGALLASPDSIRSFRGFNLGKNHVAHPHA